MNIGYKKLQNDYIAKLEILGKTNENRQDIADPQHAKYRTSKAKVLKIFKNGKCGIRIIKQMNGLYNPSFMYIAGKEIYVSDYDEDVNNVCSRGIHYFKTPYQAKMWELNDDNYTGKYIEWYDNGNIQEEGEYKNGKKEGKWTWWWADGNKKEEGEYKNGEDNGKWTGWYDDDNKMYEREYKDGKWIWLYGQKNMESLCNIM